MYGGGVSFIYYTGPFFEKIKIVIFFCHLYISPNVLNTGRHG